MKDMIDPKPSYAIKIDQTRDGDRITFNVQGELTQEGTARYQHLLKRIAPHAMAIKTSEGTLLFLPSHVK